jgi:2-dehydro-3-deoxyglucarate aldolase
MKNLKTKLRSRDLIFGSWVSFAHPSITEIFTSSSFDFHAIDMEHTTISLEQAQRIIAASQANGVPCIPRPVSHSNDWIKPLLDSGADGIIAPLVSSKLEADSLGDLIHFPPSGKRSFGVNRAHGYGKNFDSYLQEWNSNAIFIAQIETKDAISNIKEIVSSKNIDGVMIGPYDLSGSLGVPGQTQHNLVLEAEKIVIDVCKDAGMSCGTQLAEFTEENVSKAIAKGYTFIVASSDLFILNSWALSAEITMKKFNG